MRKKCVPLKIDMVICHFIRKPCTVKCNKIYLYFCHTVEQVTVSKRAHSLDGELNESISSESCEVECC